jgi:hypothetical protein
MAATAMAAAVVAMVAVAAAVAATAPATSAASLVTSPATAPRVVEAVVEVVEAVAITAAAAATVRIQAVKRTVACDMMIPSGPKCRNFQRHPGGKIAEALAYLSWGIIKSVKIGPLSDHSARFFIAEDRVCLRSASFGPNRTICHFFCSIAG